METITKKLEKIFSAVAFAEAGEFDTAREIMAADQAKKTSSSQKKSLRHHGTLHTIPTTES